MIKRIVGFSYGLVSYVIFFGTFLYAIGFIGNIFVPKTLDSEPGDSLITALLINTSLLLVFALQHSVMARPAFKKAWTRIVPELLERSTYVLFSSIALIVLFIFWQPMGGIVWEVNNGAARIGLYLLFGLGWLLVLAATFAINHFDLFGLRQSFYYLQGKPCPALPFKLPLMYRFVRHPLYVGWFVVFWATPTMTVSHLFFAVVTTLYILVAVRLEEKDLRDVHPEYGNYQKDTPMFIPNVKSNKQNIVRPVVH
jgi:methanethiol S-methyltransferase